jgi:hypothetical protein
MCNPCLDHLCYLCLDTAQEPRPTKNGTAPTPKLITDHCLLIAFPRASCVIPRLNEFFAFIFPYANDESAR